MPAATRQSYLVGTIASFYDTSVVTMAFGVTMVVSIGLTLYARQTKYDFTTKGGLLISLLLCLILFGILNAIVRNAVMQTVYGAFGALLFSCFLVYDVQMVCGGKRIELGPDEYVFAALNVRARRRHKPQIYLDIINIFLYMLRLFGRRD